MNKKVKKKEIKRGTISSKKPSTDEEEPGFKEYTVIFGSIFALFFIAYFAFEYFYEEPQRETGPDVYEQANITDIGFTYNTTTFNGRKATVEFVYDFSSLETFTFKQDLTNEWFMSHPNISIITPNVIQPLLENALLIKSSGKLASYIRGIQGVRLSKNNFQTINKTNTCEFSSQTNALIIFNYDAEELEINIDEQTPHCVEINVNQSGVDFVKAVDLILFDTLIKNK